MYLMEGSKVDAEIEKWKGVNPDQYLSHQNIELADIPQSRQERESWDVDNGKIVEKQRLNRPQNADLVAELQSLCSRVALLERN